jgi:hypothetical protein
MMRTELMKKNLAGEMTYTANMDQIMPEATDIRKLLKFIRYFHINIKFNFYILATNLVKYFATNFDPNISATLMGSLVYQAAFHNDVDYIKVCRKKGRN